MSAPTKLQRWLDLIAVLASHRLPLTVDQLWRDIPAYAPGVDGDKRTHARVRRMFERDKDELRALGIPIERLEFSINYGREQATGYRLASRSFHLPYLKLVREAGGAETGGGPTGIEPTPPPSAADAFDLSEREAAAALGGLRQVSSLPGFPLAAEARSAFRKLAFDLDADLLREDPVLHAEDREAADASQSLRRLSDALLARKTVRFRYHSMGRDATEERTVHPYGLFFQHGRWYLVGFDEPRSEPRVFRLGRMSDVVPNERTPGTPDYAIPEDFELEGYTGRRAWELGGDAEGTIQAKVRFQFPRSLWAERNGHGRLTLPLEDGGQIRAFEVHRRDPFLRWVLSLAGDATVEEPVELRRAFRSMVREVAARHGSAVEEAAGGGGAP